jgi:peptidoglycan/xylan/chitin deacetylase (PgdA/CDA1 family)
MYHAVGAPGEPAARFVVPAKRFERQMKWLVRRGYRVVTLEELLQDENGPRRAVALTFDDGYVDNLVLARPVLERLGLPATAFVVPGRERNDWDRDTELSGRALLRREQLAELGPVIAVGAHTRTHRTLTDLAPAEVETELAGSRHDLEEAVGGPVTTFAYPYGMFDTDVRSAVDRAGFLVACSVVPGHNPPGTDPLALRRLEIYGTFSLLRFVLTLWLGDTRFRMRWRARRSPLGVG